MKIDDQYRGPVRIVGKVGDVRPYMLEVLDLASGEQLDGVFRAEIILDANHDENIVTLTCYETDERGKLVSHDGQAPTAFTATVERPFVDVSALVERPERRNTWQA